MFVDDEELKKRTQLFWILGRIDSLTEFEVTKSIYNRPYLIISQTFCVKMYALKVNGDVRLTFGTRVFLLHVLNETPRPSKRF